MSRPALLVALLAAAVPAASQTNSRAIAEIADFSGLVASPDGQWVAYRIERPSTVTNRIDVDWYLVATDGHSPPRALGRVGTALWSDSGWVKTGEAKWTADSQSLIVRGLVDGRVALWRSDVKGSGFQEIVAGDGDIEGFAILADGSLVAGEGPAREAIARAEEAERETGILIEGRVDIAEPLFRGSLVNGRPATQRFTGDWFDRAPLLVDAPRRITTYDLRSGTRRTANDTEKAALAPQPVVAPDAEMLTALQEKNVCSDIPVCPDDARRLSAKVALTDGRTLVTLRDRAFRQTLYLLTPGSTRLEHLISAPGLLAGSRDEDTPCASTAKAIYCVESSPAVPPQLVRIGYDGVKAVIDAPNRFPDSDGLLAETIAWQVSGSRASGVLIRPKIPGRLPLFITYYRCPGFVRGGLGDEYPFHALASHGIAALCINVQPQGETAEDRYRLGMKTVAAAIAALDRQGLVDPARVGMGGLSFGSEVTMWTASHSRILKAAAIASVHVTPSYYWFNARPGRENFAANLRRYWELGPPDEDPAAWKRMSSAGDIGLIKAPVLMQLPENEMRQSVELQSKLATARMGESHVFPLTPHIKVEPRQKLAAYERNLDWFRYWLKDEIDPAPAKAAQYVRWSKLGPKKGAVSIDRTQRSTSAISSRR